jgi:pyruvate dehydrogenase E1 component
MAGRQEDCFYYITVYNENYSMPPMPEGAEEGIVRGMYRLRAAGDGYAHRAQLLGSGTILREVLRAADILGERFGIGADVWSVTSYQQLRADALAAERHNRLHPAAPPRLPFVTAQLAPTAGPIVASSDWIRLVPDMVSRFVPRDFTALGTDGYGISDTRTALRRHFEIDAEHVVIATLAALARQGAIEPAFVADAIVGLGVDPETADPARR